MSPSLLPLLLALGSSAGIGVSGTIRTETRGGLIPTNGSQQSDPSLDFSLVPTGQVSVRDGLWTANLSYSLRLLRRFFVPQLDERFILFHNVASGFGTSIGKGWRVGASLGASFGEVDYAFAQQAGTTGTTSGQTGGQTGTGTANSVPNANVIPQLTVVGDVSVDGRLGRNHTVGLSLGTNYNTSLGRDPTDTSSSNTGVPLFPTQIGFSANGSYGFQISGRSTLTASLGGSFVDFEETQTGQASFPSATARLGYSYRFSPRTSGGLRLGLLVSGGTGGNLYSPVGNVDFSSQWVDTRALKISNLLSVGVDGLANPVAGTFEPRMNSTASFSFGFGSDWTAGLSLNFSTPIPNNRTDPTATGVDLTGAAETLVGATIPVRYRVSDTVGFEFGVQAQASGPRLDTPDFALQSPLFTGYVALNASFSSGPSS